MEDGEEEKSGLLSPEEAAARYLENLQRSGRRAPRGEVVGGTREVKSDLQLREEQKDKLARLRMESAKKKLEKGS